MPTFHSALHHGSWTLLSAAAGVRETKGSKQDVSLSGSWLLFCFKRGSGVVGFPWEEAFILLLHSPVCSSFSAGSDCTSEETEPAGTLLA